MADTGCLPGKKPTASIVLVNYKTLEITKICLDLLRRGLTGADISVWVVDNYSADASTEYLRSLDWINLIERTHSEPEQGQQAHGRALDMVLDRIDSDYLFLMHTDTFIYDASVFSMMLDKCINNERLVAVGCVEQMNRGALRSAWRFSSRFFKYHFRRLKLFLGLKSRAPKPYREVHLKSFCTLWNAKLIKKYGLHFSMGDGVPGYELQDQMTALGYAVECLAPRKLFSYLEHIQAGTVAAAGGYHANHRRVKMYNDILEKHG